MQSVCVFVCMEALSAHPDPPMPLFLRARVCVCFSCTSALPLPLHLSFCNIKCCHSIIETAAFFRQPQRMGCSPAHKGT